MHTNSGEWELGSEDLVRLWPAQVAGSLRAAGREVWANLPAWLFFFYGCMLLNSELTNFNPPRADLAFTAVFPLAVFAVFQVARAQRIPGQRARRRRLTWTLGATVALPLLNLAFHRPSPMETTTLRDFYELSNFAWVVLLVWHGLQRWRSHVFLFFGAGMLYGAILENGGILLGFFSETHLRTAVPPFVAPVATMVGWSVVLYMAFFVVRGMREAWPVLRRSALFSAIAVATVALFLDLQIDPIATATHCWVWQPTLPGFWGGVPLVNFVAWVCALFPFAYVVFRYQDLRGLADRSGWTARHLVTLSAAIPVVLGVAGVLFMASMTALEGPQGPSMTILYQVVARFL